MSSAQEPQAKRLKMSKKIGTHNGTFHCDEALAVFMLRQTDTYANADVIRSRNPAELDTCDIVVDVGAVYDAEKLRFDHHQREFKDVFGHGFQTKLSSAGLVYKHFGQEIVAKRSNLEVSDPKVQYVWLKVYRDFVEALDGIDNGISQYPAEATPRYRNRTDLSSRVGSLNPRWNEPSDADILFSRFQDASALAGKEFLQSIDYYRDSWLPAGDLVKELITKSKTSVDPSGKILLFEQFCPWKEHLFELEGEDGGGFLEPGAATYIIYPDEIGGSWRVQAVPVSPQSFDSRKALPEAWRGVRDDALSQLTGIDGGVFVHASGFIGGNKTREGALAMAQKALQL